MKTVLITGGARGIGRATGAELARRGWTPVLADIEPADDVIALDVLDAAACERAVETVLERHGRLDAVWANAGIASFGPLALTDPLAWERTIEVNLLGAFRTIRAALPAVIEARGYVAVTASLASFAQAPGLSSYSAFEEQVKETKRKLLEFLIAARHNRKSIVGYGAPGKGNTLLNYCGIRTDFLDYTVDRNPYKHYRFLPGTHIPIYPPERIEQTRPDYVLILPWNLKKEVTQSMAGIKAWGGKFVVPIPSVQVLDG